MIDLCREMRALTNAYSLKDLHGIPENHWFVEEGCLPKVHFSGSILIFFGVPNKAFELASHSSHTARI